MNEINLPPERLPPELLQPELARIAVFLQSVRSGMGVPADPRQKAKGGFFPGLSAQPWHESTAFATTREVTRILESQADIIVGEYLQARVDPNFLIAHPASSLHPSLKAKEWGFFELWQGGEFRQQAREYLPETCRILEAVESFMSPAGQIAFHNMVPGARLRPHADGPNTTLTCHLGLVVPPNCALRVAGETRTWSEKKCLWFDHSYEHDAWNESDRDRAILLLDVMHPDITAAEARAWKAMYASSRK